MPVLVNCPSCSGPLRVADDLIGRKVRCPACQTIFDAVAPGGGANDLPLETHTIDSWKNLDLEMTRDPDPDLAPPPRPQPVVGLVGAVEMDAGPQDPPRRPPPRREDEKPASYRRQDGDLQPCPGCGKMLHADSTRCFSCGERLSPWGGPRSVRYGEEDEDGHGYLPTRRDCEPHRGTTILVLGILSLVSLMLAFCLPVVTSLVGVVLGAIAWWMAQADLSKMKLGTMDPDGKGTTQAGWICAIIGTLINLMLGLFCGSWIGFMIYTDIQRSQAQQQQGFRPAPPPVVQPAPAPMPPPQPVPPKGK